MPCPGILLGFFFELHSASETLTTHALYLYEHTRAVHIYRGIFED
jgi:hypothetical protein